MTLSLGVGFKETQLKASAEMKNKDTVANSNAH